MTRHGHLLRLAAVVAAVALVTGTGGISSLTADRPVRVAVVDDDDAYLGFEQTVSGTNGTRNLGVTVTNRFPSNTRLTAVEVSVGGESADIAIGDALAPGESGAATFASVDCGDRILVNASSSDVTVRLRRSVECA